MNAIIVVLKIVDANAVHAHVFEQYTLSSCDVCTEDDIVPLFRHPIFFRSVLFQYFLCVFHVCLEFVCNMYAYIRLTVRLMVSLNQFY